MFAEVVELANGQAGLTASAQPVVAANGKVGTSETGDMMTDEGYTDEVH